MGRFARRSSEEEIMDDLNSGGELIRQTLRELEIINRLLGGNHVTINGIKQLIDSSDQSSWKIVDVGCGGGDMLKLMAEWGRREGVQMELIGVDANPHVIDFAIANCEAYPEITLQAADIFSEEFASMDFDILTATLFFHHFEDGQLSKFIKQAGDQATTGLVINDIHRHWLAYHSINLLTGLFSKSSMVKHDAGVSVLRSFRKEDWMSILKAADIRNFSLRWMWAFRWQLVIQSSR